MHSFVSIIVVNFNGKQYLETCLKSILQGNYKNYEIIVFDNGSTDGSVEYLKEFSSGSKRVTLIANRKNIGPAEARNRAARLAKGEVLAFLDNDTAPEPSWLSEAVKPLRNESVGAVQCKLLLCNSRNRIDSIGCFLGNFGFLVQRVPLGRVVDEGQYDFQTEIFSTKSAAMLIRKKVFQEVEGFDPDFFIYNEEFDLCWRIWLRGYKVLFAPFAVVYHFSGTTKKIMPQQSEYLLYYHGSKNYILTVLKNANSSGFLHIMILHLLAWLMISFLMTTMRSKPLAGKFILEGILWNLRNLRKTMRKRIKRIMQTKARLPKSIRKSQPLSYYFRTFRSF